MAIRLGIVGAAHMHVDYVLDEAARRDDVEIVAVCDHDSARLNALCARTGAPGFGTVSAMLAAHRLDAAAVTTEPGLRSEAVVELLNAGVFTIVDKPLATTLAGLDAIEQALAGRPLLTLLLEKRHYAVTIALRRVLDDALLGEIVTITATGPHKLRPDQRAAWYFDPALYGGILNDLSVHDIDLALWLTGKNLRRVRGWASPAKLAGKTDFPLAARVILETTDGVEISIDVDWLQPDASPRHGDYALRITGTKGRADVDFARNLLTVETDTRPAFQPVLPANEPPARYALDYLASGVPLAISAADSLRATRLALLAQQSAETDGNWFDCSGK